MIHTFLHSGSDHVVDDGIAELVSHKVPSRIHARDDSVWGPEAAHEASIRLGWTHDPSPMRALIDQVVTLRDDMNSRGINHIVLCGMGGSSLAPEVIATRHGLPLTILDSTHPDQVQRALSKPLANTAVVVASKSGTTVETATARAAFEQAFVDAGLNPTDHMVFVTDPGSPLDNEASAAGFRVFHADPTVGGRFSALTAFGLVPTTLAGADTTTLVSEAAGVVSTCGRDDDANPAVVLGAALANPAKPFAVIVPDSSSLPGLGDWVEQLVAESTGKDKKGVLPVVVPHADHPSVTDAPDDVLLIGVSATLAEVPGTHLTVTGSLGEQFVVWQWATAMAGFLLDINPFDQPDVESAKSAARNLLEQRPEPAEPIFTQAGIDVSSLHLDLDPSVGLAGVWQSVVERAGTDGYIALHVYADREAGGPWEELATALARTSNRPVTLGFGPRFLHSTGQFHKGGTPSGTFVQIEVVPTQSLAIPGYPFGFGELIDAQSAGDRQVLASRGLPVVTLRVTDGAAVGLLTGWVGSREH
jgi:glucose-6-phosphate isomerase